MNLEKRNRLAAAGIIGCVILAFFLLTRNFSDLAASPVFSFFFKLTITVGAIWLAWPDLVRMQGKLPPRFLLLAPIAILILLIQPRFGGPMVAALILYWVAWWIYRKVFPLR